MTKTNLPEPLTADLYHKAIDYAKLASKTYDKDDNAVVQLGMSLFSGIDHIRNFDDFATPDYRNVETEGNYVDWWFGRDQGIDYVIHENKLGDVVVAFRGTEPLSLEDWAENLEQVVGSSEQYETAVKVARQQRVLMNQRNAQRQALGESHMAKLSFTGHSLGGGLATAAALATGCEAIVFDAAGVSDDTIGNKDLALDTNNQSKVLNINVKGCFVSDWKGKMDETTLGSTGTLSHLSYKFLKVGWLRMLRVVVLPAAKAVDGLLATTCRQYGTQIWLENVNEQAKFIPKSLGRFVFLGSSDDLEKWMETYLSHAWHLYTHQLIHKKFITKPTSEEVSKDKGKKE